MRIATSKFIQIWLEWNFIECLAFFSLHLIVWILYSFTQRYAWLAITFDILQRFAKVDLKVLQIETDGGRNMSDNPYNMANRLAFSNSTICLVRRRRRLRRWIEGRLRIGGLAARQSVAGMRDLEATATRDRPSVNAPSAIIWQRH